MLHLLDDLREWHHIYLFYQPNNQLIDMYVSN